MRSTRTSSISTKRLPSSLAQAFPRLLLPLPGMPTRTRLDSFPRSSRSMRSISASGSGLPRKCSAAYFAWATSISMPLTAGFGLLQKSGAERIVNNVQHSFQPWVILQRHKAFAVVRIHAHGAGVYDHLHVRAPRGLLVGDGVPGSAAADEHGLRRPLGPCHSQHGLLCAARTQQHHGFPPQ